MSGAGISTAQLMAEKNVKAVITKNKRSSQKKIIFQFSEKFLTEKILSFQQ